MPKRSSRAAGRPQTSHARSIASITYWRRFAAHRVIFIGIAVIFAASLVVYFGVSTDGGHQRTREYMEQPVVTVNGYPVTRAEYERQVEGLRRMAGGDPAMVAALEGQVLSGLIDQALLAGAAKARKLTITEQDIDRALDEVRQRMAVGKRAPSDAELAQQFGAKDLSEVRELLKTSLLPRKLGETLANSASLTEADLRKTYDEAKVRHILVAVAGPMQRTAKALPDAQAKTRAEKILAEVKAGKPFAEVANQYTDDPSNQPQKWDEKAKKMVNSGPPKGGELGWIRRGQMVKPFEDAVFSMKPGEIAGPVKTEYGYHIIQVEAVRNQLPPDFEKNKAQLLTDFRNRKAVEAAQKFQEEARKTMKLVWSEPALEWRYLYAQANPNAMGGLMGSSASDTAKAQEELKAKLAAYVAKSQEDSVAGIVLGRMLHEEYMRAGLPFDLSGKPKKPATEQEREQLRAKAIEAFELGLRRAEDRETRFTLASLYEQAKQNEQALAHYKQLQKFLSWDDSIATKSYRERLKAAFTRLGHPELAEKETVKLAEISRKEAEERKKQEEQKRAEEEAKKKAAKKDDKAAGSAEVNIKPGEPSPPIKLDSGSATPISPQKTESKSGEKAPAGGSTSATQQKQDGSAKR
jgi:parvulin-like peptidyl-prolyl isomerase